MQLKTERLKLVDLTADMAPAIYQNAQDDAMRRFLPDEAFGTLEETKKAVDFLIGQADSEKGPFLYPILLHSGENIGYVEVCAIDRGFEIGYHIAEPYTCRGYATEALNAAIPVICAQKGIARIWAVTLAGNAASLRVLEKCGFIDDFSGIGNYQGKQQAIVRRYRTIPLTPLQKQLFSLSEGDYAAFTAKLTPTVRADRFIGVRVPLLRKVAKEFAKTPDCAVFMNTNSLPHTFYEENLLHSVLLESTRDFSDAVNGVEAFLPYVDNWAVCDTLRPRVFAKHKAELLPYLRKWIASDKAYTCRFGLDMLMTHYLDADFKEEYLALAASAVGEDYYVRMMVAWYFSTALAKQWDAAVPYIREHRLSDWVHKKSIQKARESFCITAEQKAYLQTLL